MAHNLNPKTKASEGHSRPGLPFALKLFDNRILRDKPFG